jgi:hypothetical protein
MYRQLISVVACLLKARILKPAESAVGRKRICKHARYYSQWLSSHDVLAEQTRTQQNKSC